MKRTIIIVSTLGVLLAFCLGAVASEKRGGALTLPDGVSASPGLEGEDYYADSVELLRDVEPIYKDNADKIDEERLGKFDYVDYENVKKRNGTVLSEGCMTYKEYCAKYPDAITGLADFSDGRMVYAIEIYYPEFDHMRIGRLYGCTAVGLYDVESGQYIGGSYAYEEAPDIQARFGR